MAKKSKAPTKARSDDGTKGPDVDPVADADLDAAAAILDGASEAAIDDPTADVEPSPESDPETSDAPRVDPPAPSTVEPSPAPAPVPDPEPQPPPTMDSLLRALSLRDASESASRYRTRQIEGALTHEQASTLHAIQEELERQGLKFRRREQVLGWILDQIASSTAG